ncbi:unnamed protein product [Moneuplotes crassus]|uniref:Uncharacterized protein n=1 Tax=Euplotes crassus TaxID=5936 RepID=A0AAD1XXZ3_EUPCR|nr:unnamed protein product [Moneuplotes crassus]
MLALFLGTILKIQCLRYQKFMREDEKGWVHQNLLLRCYWYWNKRNLPASIKPFRCCLSFRK